MNKPVCLGLSILELSKILMYDFWYNYVKPKSGEKAKLCYMDTDSFIVYIKTHDIFKDIAGNLEIRFDTLNYELDRPFPKGKNQKVIGLMKDELGGKIMTKFVGVRARTYSCLIDNGSEDKKAKGIKYNYYDCFLEYTNFKDDLVEYKCLCCNKNYQHKFDKKLKERFFNTYKFSNQTIISLFYCCKKVFIHMNIWMIRKNSMKHDYLKKKIFIVN